MALGMQLVLVEAGPNRPAVILRARALLKLPLVETRALVDRGGVVLAEGHYNDRWLRELQQEFEALGAVVEQF